MMDIIIVTICVWLCCLAFSIIIHIGKEDDVDWSVIALFPANLIYVLKTFWKSIIEAIKS